MFRSPTIKGVVGPGRSAKSGNAGTYGLFAEASHRAAAERGILPREMQWTWEAARGLFDADWKTPENLDAVNAIWRTMNVENSRHLKRAKGSQTSQAASTRPIGRKKLKPAKGGLIEFLRATGQPVTKENILDHYFPEGVPEDADLHTDFPDDLELSHPNI